MQHGRTAPLQLRLANRRRSIPNSGNEHQFNSSEYAADPTLRPKLTVVYAPPPPPNMPPTVTLTSPAEWRETRWAGAFR